jgi:ribose transport system permease protein
MKAKVLSILALLFVLCLFVAIGSSDPWYKLTDGIFLKPSNIENLIRRISLFGILGIGVAFVIITGGIDLSIGSVVCLTGCLLAIFLHVDYQPFDNQTVVEIRSQKNQIVVTGDAAGFNEGDRIRYSGGRAATMVAKISRIKRADGMTLIQVDKPFSRDSDKGQIAKIVDIVSFQMSDITTSPMAEPSVTLSGNHEYLAPRDQMRLFHPMSGLNELVIRDVTVVEDGTRVTFTQDLGSNFTAQWLAIPIERRQRMPIPVALGTVLAFGLGLGAIHGLLVTRMKLQPFVVTLCGLMIYRGLSRWLVDDQPPGFKNEYVDTLSQLGKGKLELWQWKGADQMESFGLPYPFFILIISALVASVFLNKTIWGRYLMALGRNEDAALYSGINTQRITLMAYIISTGMAATGGILFALYSNQVSPSSYGNFFELYAIAAAVLGGCSLRGGEGTIMGVVVGTAVMQVLNNMIVVLDISDTLEYVIIGTVLLLGVMADELIKRIAAQRRAKSKAN